MKNFSIIIFTVLCIFLSAAFAQGQGGKYFKRGSVTFIEDSVFQFKIEIPYDTLNELRRNFINQNTQLNLKEAGFCFLPLIEEAPRSVNNPDSVYFYTKGYRAVLTLWESMDNSGVPQPKKVSFYSFNNIPDALATYDNSITNAQYEYIDFSIDINYGTSGIEVDALKFPLTDSSIYKHTREFDLVFLDIDKFDTLATNAKYYKNFSRNKKGITLERSFNGINVKNKINVGSFVSYSTVTFRSLIFRPLPVPELLTAYDSETAIAYTHGNECPPWWREPGGNVEETLLEFVRNFRFEGEGEGEGEEEEGKEEGREVEDNWPWDEEWFQWLVRLIGLGGAIYIVNKGFNNFNNN